MPRRLILVTGGAGFIGSHLADLLLARGDAVRALDDLSPQVHGEGARRPAYLHPDVELVVGDVRDPRAVRRALTGVDAVFHLAACVGVGQSMYQLERYASVNVVGTAVLLEALVERPVRRLVVASSMSVYGEGLYRDAAGRARATCTRTSSSWSGTCAIRRRSGARSPAWTRCSTSPRWSASARACTRWSATRR